jgi:hypothetical protein
MVTSCYIGEILPHIPAPQLACTATIKMTQNILVMIVTGQPPNALHNRIDIVSEETDAFAYVRH